MKTEPFRLHYDYYYYCYEKAIVNDSQTQSAWLHWYDVADCMINIVKFQKKNLFSWPNDYTI